MKTTTRPLALKELTPEQLAAFSKERGEPAWVLSLRLEAFENYSRLPWPNAKEERWKRTQLERLEWNSLQFSPAPLMAMPSSPTPPSNLHEASSVTNARLYFDFPRGYAMAAPPSFEEQSIEWLTLDVAIKTQRDRLQAAWEQGIKKAKDNKFLSLTLAMGTTGFCLIAPKGQVIKAPFQNIVSTDDNEAALFMLNFIFADEASEIQIWEELKGEGTSQNDGKKTPNKFISSYTSITLKENAKANAYYLQNWDQHTSHLQFQDVFQNAFSRYNAIAISLGGKVFHNETTIHLHGQGAENKVLGVLFGDHKQNFVNWITQNHAAPRTTSDIQYRGALKGAAHSFFSGMVSIVKEAQQSDAYQSAKCLLLSKEARADAIPNLEILADDVKCSHGAAVGPVDEDQKYYLETRGIPEREAEEIIIQGFLEPVISEVPSQAVQDQLRNFVEEKIKNQ